ncbi:carbohydrate ABC transporter substrate-binding protein, CUT1 family (TC 3.A.1.1.-) [Lentibacillus halodurans]|uniref:Probable sugar-binding periplasmic protein n=1 Tax=Lentibacillus halodurans TaxID=237679 RepID=A0A1I0XKX6_9BACI|nr:ABC transporter substrate-binding protein [Lentibacillus halodurans]SFB01779.1 carbohydrate ABC transporter substrate-binding protein, CUT1 family (TC 3.A.1.1.-) [Lentibacillus halodurans]
MKKLYGFFFILSLVLVLAACSSGSNDAEGSSDSDSEGGESSSTVEIFSWWTGAGEEDGLLALIDLFEEENPDLTIENAAVAGGAGTNAKAVLATRMEGDDPPSTFQVHGGDELNEGWVAADKMQPLNDLYEENGWEEKFPEELIELVSKDGDIYSVPVNIHRGNVIFYNKKVFEENGIEEPETFEEFFAASQKLKDAGVTPMALGDKNSWPATQIFENVLLGVLGPDDYKKLFEGEIPFDDERVVEAVETFGKILDNINEDHAARNWQDSAQLVANGEAAMLNMGDWAKGYFVNDLEMKTDEDFGYFEFPGTKGEFQVVTDTFGLPKGIENPDEVKKFLTFLGSTEAQDVFNPLKGSIPARTDADESKYDAYGKEAMKDFGESRLVPSLAHGSAAAAGFLTKANQAVNIFVTQRDVDNFIEALKTASQEM